MNKADYEAKGIRIGGGDLEYLSMVARECFGNIAEEFNMPWFKNLKIVVSTKMNEETLYTFKQQQYSINAYEAGTHLAICQKQPTLVDIFKLY